MWSSASFISIENLTNSTWKFVIKPNDNFKYTPGQFIQIKIKNIVRSYSIASYNSSENIFELLIVKLEGGVMSKILFEEINAGDKLEIKGPLGRFTLPEKIDGDIFLICTGTGLAPFRSMLQYIIQNNILTQRIYLIFGTRTKNNLLCYNEILDMQNYISSLKYIPVLSRENWEGKSGYVHDQYLNIINQENPKKPIFYLCGWRNMVREARNNLKELGFESKKIKLEIYD